MNATDVVVLVGAILVFQAVLWTVLLVWLRRRMRRSAAEMQARLDAAGEPIVLGPVRGSYSGGAFGMVKGVASIALTDRRLVFQKMVGSGGEVPLDEVIAVSENKWYRGSYTGGRLHLILELTGGRQVGFQLPDHATWMRALSERIGAR